MENNGQIVVMITLLLGSMLSLMLCTALLPKNLAMPIGGILYFTIILVGFGGGMVYTRERYNKYPHRELKVFPTKSVIPLFVIHQVNRIKEGGRNNSALIDLAFTRYFPEAQARAKKVVINYKGVWGNRIHGAPANIDANGFSVPHPDSDTLIVRYVGISLEFQEIVPVYELLMGSTDITPLYDVSNVEIPEKVDTKELMKLNVKNLAEKLTQAYQANQNISSKLKEEQRRSSEWHSLAEAQQETISQQKSEINGLLAGSASIKERALELLLSIYSGQGSLAKTIKYLKAKEGDNTLIYKIIGGIAVITIVALFFYSQPQILQNVYRTLNNIYVVIAITVICVAALYFFFRYYRRDDTAKGGKRK